MRAMHKIKPLILFVGLVAIFVAYSFVKEWNLSEDGVHYFIFSKEDTEKNSSKEEEKIKIEVYATRSGDKFKAILQPHTFIYTPERIAYTQSGLKHVYFFDSRADNKDSEEGPLIPNLNLSGLDDLGTDFLPSSEIIGTFIYIRLTLDRYINHLLVDGENQFSFSGEKIDLIIRDLSNTKVKIDIPNDAVPFTEVIRYYRKEKGGIPLLSIQRARGDDSWLDEISREYRNSQNVIPRVQNFLREIFDSFYKNRK